MKQSPFSQLLSIWKPEIVGIDFNLTSNTEYTISYVLIKKNKKRLEIKLKKVTNNIEDVFSILNKNQIVTITFSGKQVLHKIINTSNEINFEEALKLVLPNSDLTKFYVQKFKLASNGGLAISVCRVEPVNYILSQFEDKGILVPLAYLGPFTLDCISNLITTDGNTHTTINDFIFEFREGGIYMFERNQINTSNSFNLDGLIVEQEYIIPFSASIAQIMQEGNSRKILNTFNLDENRENFRFSKLTQKVLTASVFLIVLILLLNSIVFIHFYNKNVLLETNLKLNSSEIDSTNKMESIINSRINFLKEANMTEGNKTSFYIDRIIGKKPPEIQLTSLNVFPPAKMETGEHLRFENNSIYITGECKTGFLLTNWMDELKIFNWIESAEVLDFNKSRSESNAAFNIKINLKKESHNI
jgi:hypothetical protein